MEIFWSRYANVRQIKSKSMAPCTGYLYATAAVRQHIPHISHPPHLVPSQIRSNASHELQVTSFIGRGWRKG